MMKCAENICERDSERKEHIRALCEPYSARKGLRRRKSRGKEKAKTGTKNSVRISDAVSFWLASKERVLKPSSVAKYRNLASRHIVPFLGDRRIHELDREAALDFVRLLSDGKTNGGELLSRGTARDVLMILEKSVRLYGGWDFSIDKKELVGKTGAKRRTVLTDAEQYRLERYLLADTDERKLGLLLCLYAGLRIGEICAMRWKSIDLCEKTLSVNATMQRIQLADAQDGKRTAVIETAPKSGDSCRTVPIADFLIDRLREKNHFAPDSYFLTGSERYIEPRSYENFYKSALLASGIAKNNFHTLRHTFATRCIESGVDVKTVSELLGHSTVKMTLDFYVHPTMDTKKNGINRMALSRFPCTESRGDFIE